jgi:copper transport protein
MRKALALATAAALSLPAAALAHATLREAAPAIQSEVGSAPALVTLRFDQQVTAVPNSIVVRSADGTVVSAPAATRAGDRHLLEARLLGTLPKGAYTVRWRALSSDGHVGSGIFTFGVRVAAPSPSDAYGSSAPSWTDDAIRWAYFAALALLLGGLGFRLLVLPAAVPAAVERRFFLVAGIGAVGAIEAGIAAFVMRAEDALQLPFVDLLYGDLSPLAYHTRFGTAFVAMTLGYALVAALLFAGWLFGRREALWAAFAVGLGFVSGLSLSGHSGVEPNSSWLSELADWVHLSAATLWAGGLAMLALCVWTAAPELRRGAFLGFSRLAAVLIAAIVGAGVYLGIKRLPHLSDLWSTGYGQVLLVKLALVSVAIAWGALHHFIVRPRLERGEHAGGLRASLLGESAVAMGVLLVAAVLVNSAPPPQPAPGPGIAASVSR